MDSSHIVQATATGDITTTSSYLRAVTLVAGTSANATVVVRAGGSGGTPVLTLAAATSGSAAVSDLHDALAVGGIHVTLSGSGAAASIVYA